MGAEGVVFLRALRAAFGRAPLWLFVWLLFFCGGLVVAVPWVGWFTATLEHRYAPGSLFGWMDEAFRHDQREELSALRAEGGAAMAALGLLAMLAGAFTAGGWLQVFLQRASGHSVRRFLWGGTRYFWRFFRVLLLTLLLLAFVSWLLYGWPWETLLELTIGAREGNLEVLTSEWTATWVSWFQAGAFALLFALVLAWGDYTRTRIAMHDGRSASWAGLCTVFLLLLHPIRTLRPFALILFLEIGVVALFWSAAGRVRLEPGAGWSAVVLLFLLSQLPLLWQTISRAARYAAAVAVSRVLVAPLSQPDPWASRIGGPGGPQYPIDDTDDYGVSI